MARSAQTVRKPKAKRQPEAEQQPQSKRSKQQKKEQQQPKQQSLETNASTAAIAKLLGMDVATFLNEYFEKKPLVVRGNVSQKLYDGDLFSRAELLKILKKNELQYVKDLTVCKYVDGERENFESENEKDNLARPKKVSSLFDAGRYSCQFYQPQRYVDGLFALNLAFEEVFGCLAGASAYLTPPASQALAPHHDDVEVFILQTEGRKKWKLYKPLTELAGEHSSDLSPDVIGKPTMELTLEQGDMLYFPRGVIHQACTDDELFSTHVTISVYQHNSWANFLEVALPRVVRRAFDTDVAFRKGLPVGYLNFMGTQFPTDSQQARDFAASCKELVQKLSVHVDPTDLQQSVDEAAMDVVANRLPPVKLATATESDASLSPLVKNVSIRFKSRSHLRLTLGEDPDKQPFVAVYYSLKNCRVHHMGVCTCRNGEEGDDGSNANGEDEEEGDDEEGGSDSEDEEATAMNPALPASIAFPGELAAPLFKLYSSYPAFMPAEQIISAGEEDDETPVRGMLLRLWAEGLLDVSKHKK